MSSSFAFAGTAFLEPGAAVMREVKPVLACRACLAVTRPLRPLSRQLADTLASLVGNLVEDSEFFPKYICNFCRALLAKLTSFKDKCQSVQSTLHYMSFQDIPITLENIIQFADDSAYPDFKTATFVSAMPKEFNPKCSESTEKDGTVYVEIQCKSENKIIIPAKSEDDIVYDSLDTPNDMICNDNNHSDNDSSDDGGFLINLVRKRDIDTKYDKNLPRHVNNKNRKVKNEQSKSKIKLEKKTKTRTKLLKSKRDENRKTLKKSNNNESKLKCRVTNKMDKSLIECRYDVRIVSLSVSEQIKQIESRKDSLNYKGAIFKCGLCYHGFNAEATFKSHMAKHDPSRGDHECNICHLRYTNGFILNHHKTRSHIVDYICNLCGAISKSTQAAKNHFNWHKGIKYDCKICGKMFNKPNSVHGHMQWSHGTNESMVKCTICNKMCLGHKGIWQHMARMHKKAIGAVCASCGVQFHSLSAMQTHSQLGDCDKTNSACAECGEGFPSEQQLDDHKRIHHTNEWFCVECDKHFTNRDTFVKHMTLHVKPRLYKRPVDKPRKCSAKPRRRNKAACDKILKKPLKIMPMVDTSKDAGVNSYVCEICGCHKGSKQKLRDHLRMHTGEKPYQCDYCQRCFRVKGALQAHIHSHMVRLGEAQVSSLKQYHCRVCNVKFSFKNNRIRHEKIVHQEERKFACEMCGITYKWNESLKQHVNTKHLGLPWPRRDRRVRNASAPKHTPPSDTHGYHYT